MTIVSKEYEYQIWYCGKNWHVIEIPKEACEMILKRKDCNLRYANFKKGDRRLYVSQNVEANLCTFYEELRELEFASSDIYFVSSVLSNYNFNKLISLRVFGCSSFKGLYF